MRIYLMAAWLSGSALVSINEFALRRARLVHGWVTQRWNRVTESAILVGSGRMCVRPGVCPSFEFYHARLSWRCFYRV